jgi:hypothetical protein
LGGCCWFCSFLFSFFGFDEIVQPLSFLLVSLTRRSKQARRKPGGSGVGREGKGREEREGKGRGVFVSLKTSDFSKLRGGFQICQSFLATGLKL